MFALEESHRPCVHLKFKKRETDFIVAFSMVACHFQAHHTLLGYLKGLLVPSALLYCTSGYVFFFVCVSS